MDSPLSPLSWLAIGVIRLYQWLISPILGPRCRFFPSCSHYAIEAVKVHGITKGSLLTCQRLSKCHPLNEGGYDPVPPVKKQKQDRDK